VTVVCGVLEDEPRQVIEEVAAGAGSPLRQLGVDFDFVYRAPRIKGGADQARGAGPELEDRTSNVQHPTSNVEHGTRNAELSDVRRWTLDVQRSKSLDDLRPGRMAICLGEPPVTYHDLDLGLLGRHQAANAALAVAALAELRRQGWQIPHDAVRRGLAQVCWPARIEVVHRRPTVVLDAAHNLASIAALIETLEESFAPRRRVLVFGASSDKDVRGMLALVTPRFDQVIFTRYVNNPRGVPPEKLAQWAPALPPDHLLCADPAAAWDAAKRLVGPDDLLCITGSFFLAAEMRAEMARRPLAMEASPAKAPPEPTAPASIAAEQEISAEATIFP
jgi:hypothetical protein